MIEEWRGEKIVMGQRFEEREKAGCGGGVGVGSQ